MEDDLTALRHYVARLEDDLAIADNDLESLRRYSSRQALDIVTLGQEVGRLREALVKFAEHFGPLEDNEMLHPTARECFAVARAALAEKEGKS